MSKNLTTHVGSLPRTQEVVDFIFAREKEQPYDQAAFDACFILRNVCSRLLYVSKLLVHHYRADVDVF